MSVPNLRNSEGAIACALFAESKGFPDEFLRFAEKIIIARIGDGEARCVFAGIDPGTYALAVIHDENTNGKLDRNFLGIPTEGYGFSNEAEANGSAPSFDAARFSYNGRTMDLTVRLSY